MSETLTEEQIEANYVKMGHIVAFMNEIISGSRDEEMDAEYRQEIIDCNVAHLELMVAKDYWTDENMTAVNAAITSGRNYTAK